MAEIRVLNFKILFEDEEEFEFVYGNAEPVSFRLADSNCDNISEILSFFKDLISFKYNITANRQGLMVPGVFMKLKMDGYALSFFLLSFSKILNLITNYIAYRRLTDCNMGVVQFEITLVEPDGHIMDLEWARMASKTMHELQQLEYAKSWLSTLGGAFSALGDGQKQFAETAGMISVEQLRLALRLGDNTMITQCKLYYSLSLIQRGDCRLAKKIIKEQYDTIKRSAVVDRKTLNMCKGMWARLKYEVGKHKRPKRSHICTMIRQ